MLPATDYTVSYANNVNVGTATVQVTGIGNYAGSAGTTTFTIVAPAPTLDVAPATWSAPAGVSATDVTVTTNQAGWAATSDQTWLTVIPNGDTLALVTDPNPTATTRTATVTVVTAGLGSTITVSQTGATLNASTGTWTIDSTGGTQSVTVSSSAGVGWQASGLPAWLTAAASGSATTPLTLTAAPYTGGPWAIRTATITVTLTGSNPAHPLQTQVVVHQHNWPGGMVMVAHDGTPVTRVQPGWTLVGVAAGFQPGESIHGSMHSLPFDLGTQVANTEGLVQFTWVVPADTPAGTHTFVATGQTRTLQTTFTVTVPAPTLPGGGTTVVIPSGGTATPALGGWAVLLLITGAAALTAIRWRRHQA